MFWSDNTIMKNSQSFTLKINDISDLAKFDGLMYFASIYVNMRNKYS